MGATLFISSNRDIQINTSVRTKAINHNGGKKGGKRREKGKGESNFEVLW